LEIAPTNENNTFRLIFLTYKLNMALETSGQYIYSPMITRLYTSGAWRFPSPMITRLYTPGAWRFPSPMITRLYTPGAWRFPEQTAV
jgi:hypothetical protein